MLDGSHNSFRSHAGVSSIIMQDISVHSEPAPRDSLGSYSTMSDHMINHHIHMTHAGESCEREAIQGVPKKCALHIFVLSISHDPIQIKSNSTLLRIIVYNNISKIVIKNTCKNMCINMCYSSK